MRFYLVVIRELIMQVQCFFKRLEGVEKSCLMATLPTYNDKGVLMLDVGANSENTLNN